MVTPAYLSWRLLVSSFSGEDNEIQRNLVTYQNELLVTGI